MRFEPVYYGDKLRVLNPEGDVAVVTLWNLVSSAITVFESAEIDISVETSRIAVVANLYGNGLPHMLRNLLWNPQIRHIVVVGKNLSGSREHLMNFFQYGLEEVEFLGGPAFQIRNTKRTIDGLITPEMFTAHPRFTVMGDIGSEETRTGLKEFFANLLVFKACALPRIEPPHIPEPEVTRFPSDPRGHRFSRKTVMEAWTELVFRLYRFGYRNTVMKSSGPEIRIELQNTSITVEDPSQESKEYLEKYGFSLDHFLEYQRNILEAFKPDGLSYSYGNRLRGYFMYKGEVVDSLDVVAKHLKKEPDSRHEYIALWDNNRDLVEGKGCPCFVSGFFRQFEGGLTFTATFRVHNAMDGWPENLYGLMAIQKYVAGLAGLKIGSITVFSNSISIDPSALEKAKKIAEDKKTDDVVDPITGKHSLRFDPNGEFTVTSDFEEREIIVEHSFEGVKIGEYRGKTAQEIEMQLSRDCAVSLISHALYLGRTIALEEIKIKALTSNKY
jgi:thymidylate synthase